MKRAIAELAGVPPEEMALCRNTTEALNTVILGLDTRPDGSDFFSYRRKCINDEPAYGHNLAAIALTD